MTALAFITRGPNKLSDPGFELGGAIWNNGGAGTVETVSDSNTHSGGKRFKYSNNGSGGPNLLSEELACAPGRTYFAACWIIGATGAGTPQLAIRWRDATHTQISRVVLAQVTGNTPIYTYLYGTSVAPANAAFMVIDLGEDVVDTTAAPFYVDDFELSLVQQAFPRASGALSRLATPPSFIEAPRNWTQMGRSAAHGFQQFGRTWDETYPVLDTQNPNVRALLESINRGWREGLVWDIQHPYWGNLKGAGGGGAILNCRQQLVPDPENFAAWSAQGTVGVTGGQNDPFGGRAAWTIDSNTPANTDALFEVVVYSADGSKGGAIYLKQGTATTQDILFYDLTATVERLRVRVTWTAGVPALSLISGGGTLWPVEAQSAPGWYRVGASPNGIVAANTNRIYLYPDGSGGGGTVIAFGANVWNTTVYGPYRGPSNPGPLGFPLTQEGNVLYVRGAPVSVSKWLRQGDLIDAVGFPVVLDVTADVDTDASGGARIPINPPIFSGQQAADGVGIIIDPTTLFFSAVIADVHDYPAMDGTRYVDAGMTITWREEPA